VQVAGSRLPMVTVRDAGTWAAPDRAWPAMAGDPGSVVCRPEVKWDYLAWRDG